MAKPRPKSAQFIANYFVRHPDASLTTAHGVKMFGGTPHSFRQAVYRARRDGTPVHCERVFRLKKDAP